MPTFAPQTIARPRRVVQGNLLSGYRLPRIPRRVVQGAALSYFGALDPSLPMPAAPAPPGLPAGYDPNTGLVSADTAAAPPANLAPYGAPAPVADGSSGGGANFLAPGTQLVYNVTYLTPMLAFGTSGAVQALQQGLSQWNISLVSSSTTSVNLGGNAGIQAVVQLGTAYGAPGDVKSILDGIMASYSRGIVSSSIALASGGGAGGGSGSTIIPGVPDWAVLGGAALLLISLLRD